MKKTIAFQKRITDIFPKYIDINHSPKGYLQKQNIPVNYFVT